MSVFENFPYTNFHNLNLDWVLNKLKSFEKRLDNIEQNGATGGTGGGTGGGSTFDPSELEAKIAAKQDKLTFDSTPTQNSNNPVTSGGVYTAISSTTTTLNDSLTHINTELESKQDKLTFDTAPTENSTNPVTSGGVYTAIDNIKGGTTIDTTELENKIADKQDKLTFDTEPTENSTNPVTSGGIYSFCNKYNLKLFGGLFNNNNQGYTLTDHGLVKITDKTINSIAHISDIYKSDVIAISVAISVGNGVVARGSVVGNRICNVFLPADGFGTILAECYQNSSDSILKFWIRLSEDGLVIYFLSPDSTNMASLHIDSVQVEILRSDNFVSSGWIMQ